MSKATIIEAQNSNASFEQCAQKGILGKLKGIFADYKNGTRNSDRQYTEELWDNRVFGSEDVMEALETKTLFGELDHPEGDRCETLAKNAAISIVKLEKKPEEGVIYGEAEILDTPTGRILKTLADSGAKLGISSRGMGEEIFVGGQNIIDPETYDFITFDVVVTPANTKARVALTESKQTNKLTENFKKEVEESETTNQLNQLKTVLESVNMSNKDEVIELIETKLRKIEVRPLNKLTEANKAIALKLIKEKLQKQENEALKESAAVETTQTEIDDAAEEDLQSEMADLENEKKPLDEEKEFLTKSREMLRYKLSEAINTKTSIAQKLADCEKELLEAKALITDKTNKLEEATLQIQRNKQVLLDLKSVQAKKEENIAKESTEQIAKLEEQVNQLNTINAQTTEKLNRLEEANKSLTQNISANSKILVENTELKARLNTLIENEKLNSKILLETKQIKTLREDKVKELEGKIQELEDKNKLYEAAQRRFSKLDFNPVGTVKAIAENFTSDNLSVDELDLYNVLTKK